MSWPWRRWLAAWMLGAALLPAQASEPAKPPPEIVAAWGTAWLQGSGPLRFLGFRVYEARLWNAGKPVGSDWAGVAFALEIEYARELSGEKIAERSLAEMRRQGEVAADVAERWLATKKRLFPDVKAGDRITGLNLPGGGARFYVNGVYRGEAEDPEFARRFFGIWLSPASSQPALRLALLGCPR